MGNNEQLYAEARIVLPGGNTRTTLFVPPSAPYAAYGFGSRVVDEDGHETIDCNNNYTALIHGHKFEPALEAARTAMDNGTAFGLPTRGEIQLAQELTVRLPQLDQWRFCNSGTEAVMQALRIARASTGRDLIIRFTGSYHGTSDAVTDPSAPGIPDSITESVISLPVGDTEAFERAIEEHSPRLAAVLVDLMPNRAGLQPLQESFVKLLRQRTRDTGALLIVDEVITFRISSSGMQGLFGIQPDLTTLGKLIGGGFPVGAVGGTENVMAVTDPTRDCAVSWGGTFSANPITMAAGLATLAALDDRTINELNRKGDNLRKMLADAGIAHSGAGSLTRIFTDDIRTAWWNAYRGGVLMGTNGLLALSTTMTDDDIAMIADRLAANV